MHKLLQLLAAGLFALVLAGPTFAQEGEAAAEEPASAEDQAAAQLDAASEQATAIRHATTKQLEALEDLQAAIEDIHRIAESLSDRSAHSLEAARGLTGTAAGLQESIAHFQTDETAD